MDNQIFNNIWISKNYGAEDNQIDINHSDDDEQVTVNGVTMEYIEFLDFAKIINTLVPFIEEKEKEQRQRDENN